MKLQHHHEHDHHSSAAMGIRRRLTWSGKAMRAQLAQRAGRLRSTSLSAVPPPRTSADYDHELAKAAASILYRTPVPSDSGLPIYILNAAALPDADEHDFDALLPYVLARLPGEEELLSGTEYEVIFFAGGDAERAAGGKKNRPGWGWFIQAYHVLSRAMRKRLQKLYIVHERSWVRILVEMFSTIASPKFRRKIVHGECLPFLGTARVGPAPAAYGLGAILGVKDARNRPQHLRTHTREVSAEGTRAKESAIAELSRSWLTCMERVWLVEALC